MVPNEMQSSADVADLNRRLLGHVRAADVTISDTVARDMSAAERTLRDLEHAELRSVSLKRDVLRARCLLVDLLDRQGKYSKAAEWIVDTDNLMEEVRSATAESLADDPERLALFGQKIWLLIHKSVNEHHLGHSPSALARTEELYRQIGNLGLADRFPDLCFRVCFTLARHYQETNVCEAQVRYTKALEYLSAKIERVRNRHSNDQIKVDNEVRYANYNTGLVAVHLARCLLEQGQLKEARCQLRVAQVLLLRPDDDVLSAYAVFLLGCVDRQEGQVLTAIELFIEALRAFERHKQLRFYQRCRCELAKSYVSKGDYHAATLALSKRMKGEPNDRCLGEDKEKAKLWNTWETHLRARIAKAEGRLGEAKELASRCRDALETLRRPSPEVTLSRARELSVQTNIVLAEILTSRENPDSARALELCAEAAEWNTPDPTDRAWLVLTQAEIHLLRGEIDVAKKIYQAKWRDDLSHWVQNTDFIERAQRLEDRIESEMSRGFFIPSDCRDLDVDRHSERLRSFLIRRSERLYNTIEKRAEALGVKRQTLANWLAQTRKERREVGS
jgi:tetratricopeptide (TPR) repeat protein